jgi:flagellar basal-body rod modification protein FlgD
MDVASVASGIGRTTGALASLSSNFDNFLTLLTEQLKNQDPLSPMETTEFTTQLVQFTGVEQAILTNTQLEQLVQVQLASQTLSALDFIGKEISAIGNKARLASGEAQFSYTLKGDAAKATYTIRNADGDVVFTGEGPVAAGTHQISWNGLTNRNTFAPDGIYSISIEAVDASGKPVEAEPGIVGVVTGVESRDGLPVVMIGDLAVYLQEITSVRQPTTAPRTGDDDTSPTA